MGTAWAGHDGSGRFLCLAVFPPLPQPSTERRSHLARAPSSGRLLDSALFGENIPGLLQFHN